MVQPPLIELDADRAASLGSLLQQARLEKSLSVQDVAKVLLLSKGQVTGLESGIAKSFYSARIYVQAAKKYGAYLNVDFDATQLLVSPPLFDQEAGESSESATPATTETAWLPTRPARRHGQLLARPAWVWAGAAGLVASVFLYLTQGDLPDVLAFLREAGRPAETLNPPRPEGRQGGESVAARQEVALSSPVEASGSNSALAVTSESPSRQGETARNPKEKEGAEKPVEPMPAGKESKLTPLEPAAQLKHGSGDLRLTFAKPSWVEAVYSHNETLRQTFRPGQELALDHLNLKSLVIGNYSAVTAYQREKTLDLEMIRKPSGNVVRFSGEELAKLLQ